MLFNNKSPPPPPPPPSPVSYRLVSQGEVHVMKTLYLVKQQVGFLPRALVSTVHCYIYKLLNVLVHSEDVTALGLYGQNLFPDSVLISIEMFLRCMDRTKRR